MSARPDPVQLRVFADRLAAAAAAETLPRFDQARFENACLADDKNAGGVFDPVTEADREAERVMRDLIEAEYPDHGIEGEEYADRRGSGRFVWSLDPVDGTRSFICGVPVWTTLIALLEDGDPILGTIHVPGLGESYVGQEGEAWVETVGARRRLTASGCGKVADARLATTDPRLFTAGGERDAFERIAGAARLVRFGLDAFAYARLAAGTLDLVVEAGLKPHDYRALIPVIDGAGGRICDWQGERVFEGGRVIAAATPELLEEALAILRRV